MRGNRTGGIVVKQLFGFLVMGLAVGIIQLASTEWELGLESVNSVRSVS